MTKIIKCLDCGKMKEHRSLGLCKSCYQKQYKHKIIICKHCKLEKFHHAKGLCEKCYSNIWSKNNSSYQKNYNHKNNKHKSMTENKECSSYLGVIIAEQILSKIFKNVETKPYGHKGYDFKCNNGFLVDIKSACRRLKIKNNHSNRWNFAIRKNKIPDYFLCLAFDNRTDLNPEHIWLIPGNKINDKQFINISEFKITKWDEYKLDINKVINECNIMKGDK